jgi:hypothetical protein
MSIDLSGVLTIQQNYINDLNSGNVVLNSNTQSQLNNMQNSLSKLYNSYVSANISSDQILAQQQDVQGILINEAQRLSLKKGKIDSAIDGQKRIIALNDSYRARYAAYIKMLLIIIIGLVVCIVLNVVSKLLTFIPSAIFDILIAIVIFITLYICYIMNLDIIGRDNMDFDKLKVPSPAQMTPGELAKSQADAAKRGDLLNTINIGGCIGPSCCNVGTNWDAGNSVCVGNTYSFGSVSTKSGFTTISLSYNIGDIQPTAAPNEPNEFDKYSKI